MAPDDRGVVPRPGSRDQVDAGVASEVPPELVRGPVAVESAAVDGCGAERTVAVVLGVMVAVSVAEVSDWLGLGSVEARPRAGADERVVAVVAPSVGEVPVLGVCGGCTNT